MLNRNLTLESLLLQSAMFLIRMNDRLDQPVADDIGFVEKLEGYSFDLVQGLDGLDKPAALVARQVDLGAITSDNALRIMTEPSQKHKHLLGSRILCFIQNNKGLAERAPAHIGERSDLNNSTIHVLLNLLYLKHIVKRIIERT